MTQKERVRALLDRHGFVTNRMLDQIGLLHVGRNRIREMNSDYASKGFGIVFKAGPTFLDNEWRLVPVVEVRLEDKGQYGWIWAG
jgi:hypothetical protein